MTRTIKFRAWLKKEKVMKDWHPLGLSNGLPENDIVVIMQSTGLKDKNGKELFESDIVKFRSPYDKESEPLDGVGIIAFERCTFVIYQLNDFNKKYETPNRWCRDDPCDYYSIENFSPDDFEIIGNIYSDPDLLNNQSNQ